MKIEGLHEHYFSSLNQLTASSVLITTKYCKNILKSYHPSGFLDKIYPDLSSNCNFCLLLAYSDLIHILFTEMLSKYCSVLFVLCSVLSMMPIFLLDTVLHVFTLKHFFIWSYFISFSISVVSHTFFEFFFQISPLYKEEDNMRLFLQGKEVFAFSVDNNKGICGLRSGLNDEPTDDTCWYHFQYVPPLLDSLSLRFRRLY